ncbi:MAG: hypothetical protein IKX54_03000 [Lachnospiraceae bacterium]|nr:hypothetical protein [Lachnospiraceae bacterium]
MKSSSIKKRSNKRSAVNIGFVVFVVILVYIAVSFLVSLTKSHPTVYEVQKIALATNNLAQAVVVREEQVVKTSQPGYVNYYIKSGTRVAKNETVCSIDDSRQLRSSMLEEFKIALSEEDIAELKDCISTYARSYNSGNFAAITELKTNMTARMTSISDMYLLENLARLMEKDGKKTGITINRAPYSGIVSFYSDSLDGLTADAVSADTFNMKQFTNGTLYSADLRPEGSTAYKLVTNENWSLILKLTEEQFTALNGQKNLSFTITDDGLSLTMPVTIYRKGESRFARIDLSKYLIRYINKRFLTVSINMSQSEGLKIPVKSIVEKYFYVIPKEFIVYDQGKTGITVCELDESNTLQYRFYEAEVYYYDDEYAYIDESVITKHGQFITIPHTTNQYQVSTSKKLEGVYCVNKGYAQFRMIERLYDGEDYVIVKSGVARSINVYDFIWEDASTLSEDQLFNE